MNRKIKFRFFCLKYKLISDGYSLTDLISAFTLFNPCPDDTIMQFTGFKDKNGKEIYEGDIVSYWNNTRKSIVEWDEGGGFTLFSDGEFGINNDHCEIIGNIYENPELLENEHSK